MGTIVVSGLGKAYKKYSSRWARMCEWLDPFGRSRHNLHWVLRDLSFVVRPGEAMGIIGINGAGKSTLLKMIVGTTQPTVGSVRMTGRVAALLELGMGFHPDFTGRQNAVMAGQLLGMSVEEVTALMSSIEAFAEIGDYLDQPVRVYSSGMQVRLAFAVATAVRPDVLIVDEALSVGDTYFQHKSFERIRNFRAQGTTLLIVSHDKQAIQSICDRAILLSAGQLLMEGEPEAVMDYYNAMLAGHQNQTATQEVLDNGKVQTVSGTGAVVIDGVALLNEAEQCVDVVGVGQPIWLRVALHCHQAIAELVVGFVIKDRLGMSIYGTNTYHLKHQLVDLAEGTRAEVVFAFPINIGPGGYSVSVALHSGDTHVHNNYHWIDRALIFEVVNMGVANFVGSAWLPSKVEIHCD